MKSMVVMGVAGCGKSTLAAAVAAAEGLALIEGDDLHSVQSLEKMRRGIALTDEDRAGWLDRICSCFDQHPQGVVVTCSALKRAYRDRLRMARPGLGFVFMQLLPQQARERVLARAGKHFFSVALVESQFATLEDPTGEPGVLCLDSQLTTSDLRQQVGDWLISTSKA